MARSIQPLRDATLTGNIASGTAITSSIYLEGYRVAALRVSSGWSGAPITFQGSMDNSSFLDLWDDAGAELSVASGSVSSAAARAVCLGTVLSLALLSHNYVKFRSGPSSAAVNTTAAVTIVPVVVPA